MATDVLVDVIANQVAIVLTQCYNDMGNTQLLSVVAPNGNVHIHNCNLQQATDSVSQSCQAQAIHAQSSQLAPNLHRAVSNALGGGMHADQVGLVVSQSVTSEAVASCAVMAMNRVRLDLYTENGNVDIDGCDFRQQTATTIKQCVHNVQLSNGGGPLGLYLTRQLNSGLFDAVTTVDGRRISLKTACDTNQQYQDMAMLLLLVGVGLLVVIY